MKRRFLKTSQPDRFLLWRFNSVAADRVITVTWVLIRGDSGDPVWYLETRQFEGETLKKTVALRNVVSVHQ